MKLLQGQDLPQCADKVLVHYGSLYCNPEDIKDGDVVYCDTHHILDFKDVLNKREDLKIITHNSDHYVCDGAPLNDNGINVDLLHCYSIWFSQNSYSTNKKVHCLPIAFENDRWSNGTKITSLLNARNEDNCSPEGVYFNCARMFTSYDERHECRNLALTLSFVDVEQSTLSFDDYLQKIKAHKFVLCPRGNGLDTHRAWEVLMMKRVPILRREGQLESMFTSHNIPAVFVDKWNDIVDINFELLYDSLLNIHNLNYLTYEYWASCIKDNL